MFETYNVVCIVSLHCNRNASNFLCESSLTQPLRYAAYCCWIKQGQMPLATKSRVSPCEWGPAVLTSGCEELRGPLRLSSVTLTLPDANVWHRMTKCCLGITPLQYTFIDCRWISAADTLLSHKQRITVWNSKRDQFSKLVTILELPQLFCTHLAYDSNYTGVKTRTLCHLCEHHYNFL